MLTVQRTKVKFLKPVGCLASPNTGDFAKKKSLTDGEVPSGKLMKSALMRYDKYTVDVRGLSSRTIKERLKIKALILMAARNTANMTIFMIFQIIDSRPVRCF